MSKLELLKKYLEMHEYANQWIETVPHEIRATYFDNPYCNAFINCCEQLMDFIFSEQVVNEITWYLYERAGDNSIEVDQKVYFIHSIDDFISYVREQHEELMEQPNGAARTFRGR